MYKTYTLTREFLVENDACAHGLRAFDAIAEDGKVTLSNSQDEMNELVIRLWNSTEEMHYPAVSFVNWVGCSLESGSSLYGLLPTLYEEFLFAGCYISDLAIFKD